MSGANYPSTSRSFTRSTRSTMLKSWFGSKSSSTSRQRTPQAQTAAAFPPPGAQNPPKNTATLRDSQSQSTIDRHQTNIASAQSESQIPLADILAHEHINDPSTYTAAASTNARTGAADVELLQTYGVEGDGTTPKDSNAVPTEKEKNTTLGDAETLFTPHDAIFAAVFGRPAQTDQEAPKAPTTEPTTGANANYAPGLSGSFLSDSSAQAASNAFLPTQQPSVTLYDPFSGARLGEHTPILKTTDNPTPSATFPPPGDPKLWSHLERILELQAEISAMHAGMEGVRTARGTARAAEGGGGVGKNTGAGMSTGSARKSAKSRHGKRRPSRRAETLPIGDDDDVAAGASRMGSGDATDASSETSSNGPGGHEDEDDEDDVHGFGRRRREEEFSRLAVQFKERKVAIDAIMNKLDDLSSALQMFHTLPMPHLNMGPPASRTNTMTSGTSNASRGSTSSPPYQNMSFSPPASPFTVPPISPPLAPLRAVGGSGLGIVTPMGSTSSAPGTVQVPAKIIAETAQVESPIDMHPTQSAFVGTDAVRKEEQ
ncbi:hypothetical protein F5I97DRAFT_1208209 [Phlebopus sp. FC_14]|nr:hypothetical protein F5I97DRAFT_1208209 [Phlebopus sp. FC_14]